MRQDRRMGMSIAHVSDPHRRIGPLATAPAANIGAF
jgi:hypothetical protein